MPVSMIPPPNFATLTPPGCYWYDAATGDCTIVNGAAYLGPMVLDPVASMAAWNAAVAASPTTAPDPAKIAVWDVPLINGVAHGTLIAPPAIIAGQCPVFSPSTQTWSQVPDFRAQPYYDATGKQAGIMTSVGPLPSGMSADATLAPVVAAKLAQAKITALAGVIAYADRLTAQITSTYPAAERASWPQQSLEAKTWLAAQATSPATTPASPLLTAIVAAGVANGAPTAAQISAVTPAQITTLANTVQAKATQYDALVVAIIGMRGAAATAINAAPDLATLATTLTGLEASSAAAATAFGLTP